MTTNEQQCEDHKTMLYRVNGDTRSRYFALSSDVQESYACNELMQ